VIYFIFRFRLSGMKSESMTLNEKIMVQGTFALLAPIADVAANYSTAACLRSTQL